MTNIFEIKNGFYNICIDSENGKYQKFFLLFDKRYPEDDGILIEVEKFNEWKDKKIPYHFGFPFAGCRDSGCNTPKERCEYIDWVHFTSHEYQNHFLAD